MAKKKCDNIKLKEEFKKMLLESLLKDLKKKSKKECNAQCKPKDEKKKKKRKSVKKKMSGGDNFVKDLQRAGNGLGLSMEHTFNSMSNLGKDMYCETDAIMNIGKELDTGYSKDCPFTKTKSWDYEKIKQ